MTSFDYILISFVLMTGVSIVNARLARVNFATGANRSGWFSLALSALGGAAALFNLTQLASM
jgi:hypothetical protein